MSSAAVLANKDAIKLELENERRDIKDIWNDALCAYKGVLGEELKPTFANVDAMIESANKQMDSFHKWRHDGAKVDKLRSLFMGNIVYIQTATQKIIAAAEPAFPPAAAISTAITFVLSACKSVSADYDVVTAFFDDMNSFLQRVSILEARLPTYKAYQACLTDVFTSLLKMCAFAQKFIKIGRLKKWVISAFQGDDSDLAASRKAMDKALNRLQSATEFAILANTENLVSGQQVLNLMQQELQQNQQKQIELQESQHAMLQTMLEGQVDVKDEIGDIKKLLEALQGASDDQEASNRKKDARSVTNAVRAIIEDIPENELQLQRILDAHLSGTCRWIFEEPAWKSWYTSTSLSNASPLLLIKGSDGIGKSHLAAAIYEQIERDTDKDPSGSSCVICFFGHESIASLKSFQSFINSAILQISDKNVVLRNGLNMMLSRDPERMPEKEYLDKLMTPLFSPTSSFYLYIVIDAIDALETDWDKDSIFDLVNNIKQNNLRIKIAATMRSSMKPTNHHESGWNVWASDNELVMTKDKVLPDMRTIIQDRLRTTDSAFRGIRYLKPDIKELIASKIEARADGPLYIEQSLLYLSNLGREGPIKKLLAATMPADVTGWFRQMIEKCQRRTPQELAAPLDVLLTWLLFSFDSLTLDGINQLLRTAAKRPDLDLGDEIMNIYGVFLQIHSATTHERDVGRNIAFSVPGKMLTYEDAHAQLIFRKRSMRDFFLSRRADAEHVNKSTITSHGHRQLFLLCCQVIEEQSTSQKDEQIPEGHDNLCQYALKYCLRHWHEIRPEFHSPRDNVAVYEAFFNLMTHAEGFPSQIEAKGLDFTIGELLTFHKNVPNIDWDVHFSERWEDWSNWLQDVTVNPGAGQLGSQLTASTRNYWTGDHNHALIPLVKAHLHNWLAAEKPNEAYVSYDFGRKTIQKTCLHEILCQEYPIDEFDGFHDDVCLSGGEAEGKALYDEILRLRNICTSNPDSNSHFATAVLTKSVGSNRNRAVQEMEQAVEKSCSIADKFRYLAYMGKLYYWEHNLLEDSLQYYRSALELREQVPLSDVLHVLELKAVMLFRMEKIDDAFIVYQEICSLDPDNSIVDYLAGMRLVMHMRMADWSSVAAIFFDMNPIQRLKIALRWFNWHNPPYMGVHPAILRGALAAGKVDELLRTYTSLVGSLEVSNMGPIWAPFLAQIHSTWFADTVSSKAVLMKALDTSCGVQVYPLAEVDSGFIAVRNVNMLSDILFEQFQKSRDLETKVKLLTEEASSLLQRLLPQSVQISDNSKIPHLLVLANMTRKVGTAQEFERLLRQAFDIAWASLNDSITSNDFDGVRHLSRVIGQIPDFQQQAEILACSMLYYLGDESFFAAFCEREGLSVEGATAAKFEDAMKQQAANDAIEYNSDLLSTDYERLHPLYQKYKSASSGSFNNYFFLRELKFREAFRWKPLACTRSAFCADEDELDCNALSRDCRSWDEDGPMYTCLFCTDSMLCQKCYDVRIKWNTEGKPENEPAFCCSNGRYLRSPTHDWLGIKLQSIYLKGQEPIKFNDFLQQIRARWNEYWDQFWIG